MKKMLGILVVSVILAGCNEEGKGEELNAANNPVSHSELNIDESQEELGEDEIENKEENIEEENEFISTADFENVKTVRSELYLMEYQLIEGFEFNNFSFEKIGDDGRGDYFQSASYNQDMVDFNKEDFKSTLKNRVGMESRFGGNYTEFIDESPENLPIKNGQSSPIYYILHHEDYTEHYFLLNSGEDEEFLATARHYQGDDDTKSKLFAMLDSVTLDDYNYWSQEYQEDREQELEERQKRIEEIEENGDPSEQILEDILNRSEEEGKENKQ
ncbi:hypothetical protein K8O68_08115 [Salipaludibacillus sp. CUR1]|uniref:hypothetical protein n=1 Tax=Salipaludibacillus sp. CUR1 TaxID=2820003 RepID=UPI001E47C1F8|nr:hypothetical protein [Salipaludibacillus sp. CUR1]MCE7792381.1 hypothetical protein [Salipaludibacillus sp. CUR1]